MADHYFSMLPGETGFRQTSKVTVDTSSTAGSKIELRITDGGASRTQVYNALEYLADLFATKNLAVIPTGMLTD